MLRMRPPCDLAPTLPSPAHPSWGSFNHSAPEDAFLFIVIAVHSLGYHFMYFILLLVLVCSIESIFMSTHGSLFPDLPSLRERGHGVIEQLL